MSASTQAIKQDFSNVEPINENQKNQNLSIWNHANKTDPSATTDLQGMGYAGTGINGNWMVEKATELWGPMGDNWGIDILDDRFDQGGPIFDADKKIIVCNAIVHTIKINLWYMKGEKKCVIPSYGHTNFVYHTKWGPATENDAPKKSLTDALKKALSMLGFCSDIYGGQYENAGYKASITAEYEAEKQEQIQIEQDEKIKDLSQYIELTRSKIKSAETLKEINCYCKTAIRHLTAKQKIHVLKKIAENGILIITKEGAAYKEAIFKNQNQVED
jgi:hypothetical protein